jgi:hypothetical protein
MAGRRSRTRFPAAIARFLSDPTRGLPAASFESLILVSKLHIRAAEPHPSWIDTAPDQTILAFVGNVTKESSAD